MEARTEGRKLNRREALAFMTAALLLGQSRNSEGALPRHQAGVRLDERYSYYCPELVEITTPGRLVQPDGTAVCSWSRRPFLELNFEDARFMAVPGLQRFRMKKWDMYHLITPEYYLSFLAAWIGYGAFASAYVYDRTAKKGWEDIHLRTPFPEFPMMRDSTAGLTRFRSKKVMMAFEVEGEKRRLKVEYPGFAGLGLWAEIELYQPAEMESICATHLTTPLRMHYDHKINCMPARGEVRLGTQAARLTPETSLGMLDFARGFFPSRQFWFWAVSSGRLADGKLIGWNLGYGNSPHQTNENAVFYDLALHKIGVVTCEVPHEPARQPWRVFTPDGTLELVFMPENLRQVNLNAGLLYSRGQVALGYFSGRLPLETGKTITIENMFGLYEWIDQKW